MPYPSYLTNYADGCKVTTTVTSNPYHGSLVVTVLIDADGEICADDVARLQDVDPRYVKAYHGTMAQVLRTRFSYQNGQPGKTDHERAD